MSKIVYHLTIGHAMYLSKKECYLTFKADGVYDNNINYKNLKLVGEYMPTLNKYIIFDCKNLNMNINSKMINLLKILNINEDLSFLKELEPDNIYDIVNKFISFYKKLINNYNYIPKLYLKINMKYFYEIINILYNYFPNIGHGCDGWIITSNELNMSAKIKPDSHMTIDLKFKNNKFYTNEKNLININYNKKLINNKIYRCYFKNYKWIAGEIRIDKKYANPRYIIELIRNQIINKIDYTKVKLIKNNIIHIIKIV